MTDLPQSPFMLSAEPPQVSAETAPASNDWNPEDAGATNHIGEIFVGARKLESRFVLDERAFMEAIEPPPLFLQRAV